MASGLKSSIVIVNEFTVKKGSGGSRGGTPGDYVRRYMARDLATESVAPVRLTETSDYIERYMARKEATETLLSVPEIKRKMKQSQKDGGVAFGYGDVSLSDEKLKAASSDIQWQFDHGKTVLKTVLSFDEEYLREHGILDEDFVFEKRGDFRGHIDQMKLRMAIMNGMEKLSRRYDDLQYVGVIQVDTAHVHCHLAMVDRGHGFLMKDGTQRGKLKERDKSMIRRGVDAWLDRNQTVKMMSSSVMHDKRNALCHIKRFTHNMMAQQGLPQFLVACLPDDRRMWRAGTNRKEMRKPNAIVREYVTQVLSERGSGYREAMQSVKTYALYRRQNEDLSELEYNRLIRDGQERIIEDCMNGVYGVLKQIPKEDMQVRTGMLTAMSQDYESMAAQSVRDPMVEFGFKLRSYSSRRRYHQREYEKYRQYRRDYEQAENKSDDSKAMQDFFLEEERYHQMLMVKYMHFLKFMPAEEGLFALLEEDLDEKSRLDNLKAMRADASIRRMVPENAERYGLAVYGQHGGRHLASGAGQLMDERIHRFERRYEENHDAFLSALSRNGLAYEDGSFVRKLPYSFDEVKALDIHHMGYDFPYDLAVSKVNVDAFCTAADTRFRVFTAAKEYLVRSGQSEAAKTLPEKDVVFMKEYADRFRETAIVPSTRLSDGQKKRSNTIRLGRDFNSEIRFAVEASVRAASFAE